MSVGRFPAFLSKSYQLAYPRISYAEATRHARQRDRIVYIGAIILSLLIAASVIAALARGLPAAEFSRSRGKALFDSAV